MCVSMSITKQASGDLLPPNAQSPIAPFVGQSSYYWPGNINYIYNIVLEI